MAEGIKEKTAPESEAEITTGELQIYQIPELDEIELQKLEGNVQAWKRAIVTTLKMTKPKDWSDQSGYPYLEACGAEPVANPWGINLVDEKREKVPGEDDKGKYYIWIYKARAYLPRTNRWIDVEGVCSSRHTLFAIKDGQLRPIEDIDEVDIMTTARRKLLRNAVVELLGLRNVTWEELEAAGILREKVAKFERKAGSELSDEAKKKRKAIGDMMRTMFGEDKEKCRAELKEITEYINKKGEQVPGVENLNGMSQRKLEVTYDKVKREYEQWTKQQEKE